MQSSLQSKPLPPNLQSDLIHQRQQFLQQPPPQCLPLSKDAQERKDDRKEFEAQKAQRCKDNASKIQDKAKYHQHKCKSRRQNERRRRRRLEKRQDKRLIREDPLLLLLEHQPWQQQPLKRWPFDQRLLHQIRQQLLLCEQVQQDLHCQ
ncbi:hypothetical protein FBU59_000687 [Linderina macrospora]|uniref:Uncharacterized protein n=1 Tax=Linderina macrospora TaxID=4868 RepID=A0ACC1JG20_9FUNG|nr:hypothetical protein FBU59_000687 [Linderina macrospora]